MQIGRGRPGDRIEAAVGIAEENPFGHGRLWVGRIGRLRHARALLGLVARVGRRRIGGGGLRAVGLGGESLGRVSLESGALTDGAGPSLRIFFGVLEDCSNFIGLKYRAITIFVFLSVRVDDPQHEEERHHRRHEVGEGDLPSAPVMLLFVGAATFDDDDFRGDGRPSRRLR